MSEVCVMPLSEKTKITKVETKKEKTELVPRAEPKKEKRKSGKKETEINSDLVLKELYSVYLKCSQEIPVTAKDKETGKQVPTGVYQFDSRCALKALQLLGDALGMFKSKGDGGENSAMSYEEILKNGGFEYEF